MGCELVYFDYNFKLIDNSLKISFTLTSTKFIVAFSLTICFSNFSFIANDTDDQCSVPFNCSSTVELVVGKFAGEKTIPFVYCIVGIPPPDDRVLNAICFIQSSNLYSIIS